MVLIPKKIYKTKNFFPFFSKNEVFILELCSSRLQSVLNHFQSISLELVFCLTRIPEPSNRLKKVKVTPASETLYMYKEACTSPIPNHL